MTVNNTFFIIFIIKLPNKNNIFLTYLHHNIIIKVQIAIVLLGRKKNNPLDYALKHDQKGLCVTNYSFMFLKMD